MGRKIIDVGLQSFRHRTERALAWSLYLGAAADLFFAAGILVSLRTLGRLLHLEIPEQPIYARLCGVLLVIVAGFYALAADRVRENLAFAAWAAIGRILGAAFLFGSVRMAGAPDFFLAAAAMDLAFGLVHAVLLAGVRASR